MKVGILTDFPSIAVQSGPALHTRFLYQGLRRHGHDVTLIGPDTGVAAPIGEAPTHLFKGVPYPSHPNVRVVVPQPFSQLESAPKLDVIHGQTNNHIIEWANWTRKMHKTAVLNTHIIHLPTHSHFILSDRLFQIQSVRDVTRNMALDLEREFGRMYNEGDALIVQSRYMVDYWRERGVTVPIEVVGRPIDPAKFSAQPEADPFPASMASGKRLVCVCRHDREKNLYTLLEIFDQHLAPADPDVTLTLIGDGHDNANLRAWAAKARHGNRIYFPGEIKHARLVDWYSHADAFVYTSLSETFGNVVNEALWTGLPVVALDDRMGVAHQVVHGENGYLITPDRVDTNEAFARGVLNIVRNRSLRRELGQNAANIARRMSHPDVVVRRFEGIYERAIKRAHDEVREPLSDKSLWAQRRALAVHAGRWARWNYLLLAVSNTVGKLGFGRQEMVSTVAPEPAPQREIRVVQMPSRESVQAAE